MPFTPAHILAVVPIAAIRRSPLPFSALVIGGMIPDFPLFVAFSPDYGTTHSAAGLFTAGLPLGLAWTLAFQLLMKRPLFALLPSAIRRRCASLSAPSDVRSLKFLTYASLAVVIGAATHVLWDSFTHQGRWGTRQFPLLNETVWNIAGYEMPGFKLLQYGCTMVSLPCLGVLLVIWLSRRVPGPIEATPILSGKARAAAYLVAASAPAAASLVWLRGDLPAYNRAFHAVTTAGLVLMVVSLAYCFAFLARHRPS